MTPARWWTVSLLYVSALAVTALVGLGYMAGWPGLRCWWGSVDMAHPTATVTTLLSLAGLLRHLWYNQGRYDQ